MSTGPKEIEKLKKMSVIISPIKNYQATTFIDKKTR